MAQGKPFLDVEQVKLIVVLVSLVIGGEHGLSYLKAPSTDSQQQIYDMQIIQKISSMSETMGKIEQSEMDTRSDVLSIKDALAHHRTIATVYPNENSTFLAYSKKERESKSP